MEVINCIYNKYNINILAIILAVLIVFGINAIVEKVDVNKIINKPVDNKVVNNIILKSKEEVDILNENKWFLEIEKIGLIAEIVDGTDEETLDNFIGHFSSTPVKIGNVGLAAHNRGYKHNYFSRLKELEIGDKINYYINGHKFIYEVEEILIIHETDWSMLKDTKDNRITMITCVENREKYRLCVQAVIIKEE